MAKYQLVFIRLESTVSRLIRIRKGRQTLVLAKAMERLRTNVATARRVEGEGAGSVLRKLRTAARTLEGQYIRVRTRAKARLLARWRLAAENVRAAQKTDKAIKEASEKWKKELGTKEAKISQLEQNAKKNADEIEELKRAESLLSQTLKELEEKEKAMREAVEKFRKRGADDRKLPKDAEERLRELETHIRALEGDNKALREQIGATEGNVESFIQEMSDLIDSREFASISPRLLSPG